MQDGTVQKASKKQGKMHQKSDTNSKDIATRLAISNFSRLKNTAATRAIENTLVTKSVAQDKSRSGATNGIQSEDKSLATKSVTEAESVSDAAKSDKKHVIESERVGKANMGHKIKKGETKKRTRKKGEKSKKQENVGPETDMLRVMEEEESDETALSRKRSKRDIIAEESTEEKQSKDRVANSQADSERVAQSLLDAAEKEPNDKKQNTGATKAQGSTSKNPASSAKLASKKSADAESKNDSTKIDSSKALVTSSNNLGSFAESNSQKPSVGNENITRK